VEGFQQVRYQPNPMPDHLIQMQGPAEPLRLPAGAMAGAPGSDPRGTVPTPAPAPAPDALGGCPGCLDANVAVPPGMRGYLGKGGFPNEDYNALPKELHKVTLPPYILEPPDILLIDAGRLIPKPPYILQPLDTVIIQATETFPNQPINGIFTVGPDGTVALGFGYGTVKIVGMTLEKAQAAIRAKLAQMLKEPQVTLGLAALQTVQQVRGQHLVRQDGTISLGVYGCVYVAGMSMCQALTVIETHLSQFFQDPEIALDVLAYNSKAYYVIFDGGGYGQQVLKFPITGNETVLDAIYNAGGLPAVSSRKHIWVARPSPADNRCVQVLPVDWLAIVESGSTRTNYQLFPGDRIYVKADPLIWLDNTIAKVLSPIERIFGVTLLGASIYNQFHNTNNRNNNSTGFVVTGF
jgi:protein involved in polysaccharide export with SLBB domain